MKRAFDFTVALILILLFSPLLLILTVLIWMRMGWPVLFRQKRPGRKGAPFYLRKFRSMTNERDENGKLLPNEKRLTSLGAFIRKTSLDELPSLWNVLNGDMSLVGPRPLRTEYLSFYTERQQRRHEVRPGVTGWAQVNGRNNISWEEKFELDVWYVENRTFLLDLKILALTFWKVLKREGIDGADQQFVEPFKGVKLND